MVAETDDFKRTNAMPLRGVVEPFDAGWDAQKCGLSREASGFFARPEAREWVLIGWDCRKALESKS